MTYDLTRVKQIKLVTGEEVICEVVDEDDEDIIVRNALTIQFQLTDDGIKMWTFKYFMCYQDDPDRFLLIKPDKIVSVASPVNELLKQYVNGLEVMLDYEDEPDPIERYVKKDSDGSNIIEFPTVH